MFTLKTKFEFKSLSAKTFPLLVSFKPKNLPTENFPKMSEPYIELNKTAPVMQSIVINDPNSTGFFNDFISLTKLGFTIPKDNFFLFSICVLVTVFSITTSFVTGTEGVITTSETIGVVETGASNLVCFTFFSLSNNSLSAFTSSNLNIL